MALFSAFPRIDDLTETTRQQGTILADQHGERIDQVAAALFPDFSRSRLQAWIRDGSLTMNGEKVRPRDKALVGAQLKLDAQLEAEVTWMAEAIALDILFEDEHVLVVNKPAGLVVHPGAGNTHGTLVNALLNYAPELALLPRGGIVHRLDKETSGVMFVARSTLAHRSLVAQLAERTVKREYAAICLGALSGGATINAPIARHPSARTKMAVVESGKPAITHYRLLKRFGHHSHIAVNLETGRTHQIRVHMAWKKHPLVGDPVYGGRPRVPPGASQRLLTALREFSRQALHARSLAFDHPSSGERIEFTTELPEDLQVLLQILTEEDPNAQCG